MDQDQLDQSSPPTKVDTSLSRDGYDNMHLQDTEEGAEPLGARERWYESSRNDMEKLEKDVRKAGGQRSEEQERELDKIFDNFKLKDEELEHNIKQTLARLEHWRDKFNIEKSDERESRLNDEYSETPDPVVASSPSNLVHFMQTSPSQHPPVGSQWPKANRREINLSLRGRHCSFTGPVHSKSHLPQSTLDIIVKLESAPNIRMKRIVLGEELSYFVHYHHDGTFLVTCYYNGSVQKHYPSLLSFLGKAGNTGCPQAISLGPAGSYFIRVDGRRSFHCHPNAPIKAQAKGALRLWWGVDGAYVLEREAADEPRYEHKLRGCYGNLGDILDKHGREKKIWDLALNIVDKCSFAVVFDDGSVFHAGTDVLVCSKFDEYANKHFGDVWGDVTTCVKE